MDSFDFFSLLSFIKNTFILMWRTIHHKKWIWWTHGAHGFYYFTTCRSTDMLLKPNYFLKWWDGGGAKRTEWIFIVLVHQSCVLIYVIHFIYFSIWRLIPYICEPGHPKELFFRLGTVVRRALGFWIRAIVNASRVESKYWHCFWGITVQQSVISGGYNFTRRLSKALILTPYLATHILFLASFDLFDTSHFHFMVPFISSDLVFRESTCPSKEL